MSKMFECLGDCADFDLVNGCVGTDHAETQESQQEASAAPASAAEAAVATAARERGGGNEGGDYADGEQYDQEEEDGSQYSTDVSGVVVSVGGGAPQAAIILPGERIRPPARRATAPCLLALGCWREALYVVATSCYFLKKCRNGSARVESVIQLISQSICRENVEILV